MMIKKKNGPSSSYQQQVGDVMSSTTTTTKATTTSIVSIQSLGRYSLSVILSYLTEIEGCSSLITRKRWSYQLLPQFRLPNLTNDTSTSNDTTTTNITTTSHDDDDPTNIRGRRGSGSKIKLPPKHRHQFIVVPVQDATVLLDRFNTRRYCIKRRRRNRRRCGTGNPNHNNNNNNKYTNKTIRQLANEEWDEFIKRLNEDDEEGDDKKIDDDKDGTTSTDTLPSLTHRHNDDDDDYDDDCYYPPLLKMMSSPSSSSLNSQSNNNTFMKSGITVLASYPRSGNTLLRTYLEDWFGIVTGSDTRSDRTLSKVLASKPFDLIGEGLTSSTCTPIVKTHWPERVGNQKYEASRAILLIRNPYDAIDSCWNLNVTNTHTCKVVDEVYKNHQNFYSQYVTNELQVWYKFHKFWLSTQQSRNHIPILIIRYEDLIDDPITEMMRILHFTTNLPVSSSSSSSSSSNRQQQQQQQKQPKSVRLMERRLQIMLNSPRRGYKTTNTNKNKNQISNHVVKNDTVDDNENTKKVHQIGKNDDEPDSSSSSRLASKHGKSLRRLPSEFWISTLHLNQIEPTVPPAGIDTGEPTDDDDADDLKEMKVSEFLKLQQMLGYHIVVNTDNVDASLSSSSSSPSPSSSSSSSSSPLPSKVVLDIRPMLKNQQSLLMGLSPSSLTTNTNTTTNSTRRSLTINTTKIQNDVRPKNCPFGRNMRNWRRSHTENDTKPFPTK